MLIINWISSECFVQAGQASPLYVNTKISMVVAQLTECWITFLKGQSLNVT